MIPSSLPQHVDELLGPFSIDVIPTSSWIQQDVQLAGAEGRHTLWGLGGHLIGELGTRKSSRRHLDHMAMRALLVPTEGQNAALLEDL